MRFRIPFISNYLGASRGCLRNQLLVVDLRLKNKNVRFSIFCRHGKVPGPEFHRFR
jgi:hypothetical protein